MLCGVPDSVYGLFIVARQHNVEKPITDLIAPIGDAIMQSATVSAREPAVKETGLTDTHSHKIFISAGWKQRAPNAALLSNDSEHRHNDSIKSDRAVCAHNVNTQWPHQFEYIPKRQIRFLLIIIIEHKYLPFTAYEEKVFLCAFQVEEATKTRSRTAPCVKHTASYQTRLYIFCVIEIHNKRQNWFTAAHTQNRAKQEEQQQQQPFETISLPTY